MSWCTGNENAFNIWKFGPRIHMVPTSDVSLLTQRSIKINTTEAVVQSYDDVIYWSKQLFT